MIRQRKLTLYGVRARQTPEDENEHQMRGELRLLLREVFGGSSCVYCAPFSRTLTLSIGSDRDTQLLTTKFWEGCPALLTSPRYEQVRTIREWLLPILRKHIAR